MIKEYIKDDEIIIVRNEFIYESLVYYLSKDLSYLMDSKFFVSKKEIKNLVKYYKYSANIEQTTYLVCAPEEWLIDNNYKLVEIEYKYDIYNGKN